MCPLVIYTVEALTSDIQKYAIALVHKTKELSKEKKKMDELLYQMVPKPVAERLKMTKEVDAEYFKSVTIMFSDIFGFTRISQQCSPLEIVSLLNNLYTEIDQRLDHYDVYKVEAINDSYMVASGLPTRIGNRHSAEVANLALDLLSMVVDNRFSTPLDRMIQLRIGINTGPCMAGIVGTIMPRYCLFGDAVNTASRMKSYGSANKIHVSASTYNSLRKHGVYVMAHRGKIMVKGKGSMMTYWLLTRTGNDADNQPNLANQGNEKYEEEPGEVQQYISHSSGKFSMFGLAGTNAVQPSLATQLGHNEKLEPGSGEVGVGPCKKSRSTKPKNETLRQGMVSGGNGDIKCANMFYTPCRKMSIGALAEQSKDNNCGDGKEEDGNKTADTANEGKNDADVDDGDDEEDEDEEEDVKDNDGNSCGKMYKEDSDTKREEPVSEKDGE